MLKAHTSDPADTQAFAAALAGICREGDLIILSGSLGAGKTVFAKGLGAALGVEEPITSPTFTIVHEYHGRLPVFHLDVYRLTHFSEVEELGLGEILDSDGVALIEWGDAISPALPQDYLEVRMTHSNGDDDRDIELISTGPTWQSRAQAVAAAVDSWCR